VIDGVHFVRVRRPGKPISWYVYAWRGGPRIMQAVCPTKPKLDKEALEKLGIAHKAANSPPPGTLLSLIREWRPNSPEWEALGAGTKRVWSYELDRIEAKWGNTPLSIWSDPRMVAKVVQWRDGRKETPRSADMGVQVLWNLLSFGRLRGRVTVNVAADIPTLYRGGDRAEIIWTQDDIDRFCVVAIALDRPQMIDAIYLAAFTGLRRQDLVSLTWDHVGEFAVVKRALKRSARKRRFATMPRVPDLDALLTELRSRHRKPGVETVLVNSFGASWGATGDGFGGTFNRIRDAAGVIHASDGDEPKRKHLHDVRGTFVTKLMLTTDLSDKEIADVMAWSPERVGTIRRVYVDDTSVVVALGERIAAGRVKQPVKRSAE
jgi:integrase